MNKIIVTILLLITYSNLFCQKSPLIINEIKAIINPLDTLVFDEIIAYNINFDSLNNKKTYSQLSENVNDYDLSSTESSSKRNIDSILFNDIIKIFSDTTTYGSNYADCFVPRLAFQFKYKNKENFRIIICEDCGFLISTIPISLVYLKYYDNQYEKNGEEVIYRRYLKGFSEIGHEKINELCRYLKMGYCKDFKE